MVKATFNGDAENSHYQCAEFHARLNNDVNMSNECWDAIGAAGKQGLFTVISNDANPFPAQRTVGPK